MKNKNFLWFVLILIYLIFSPLQYVFSGELRSIDFYQQNELSKLELIFDQSVGRIKKFHVIEDKQIILDVKNTTAVSRVLRAFDTSEFSGSVVFVSPYIRAENPNDLRITIQLRDNVRSLLEYNGNKVILSVENRFGVLSQQAVDQNSSSTNLVNKQSTETANKYNTIRIPKSDSVEDILENITLSGTKRYVGKRITFNVKSISFVDLLKMIADSSGFNIIISDEIKNIPPTSLTLTNIPWDQALDTVLMIGKLHAVKNGNILIVSSLTKAAEEAKKDLENRELDARKIPLVTRIFPISFAVIADLKTLMESYLTKDRGTISLDSRTNSIIVKDTAEVIEKLKRIIETLDTQTPQILIETKIVEATESFSRDFGIKEGLNFGYDPFVDTGTLPGASGSLAFSSAPVSGTGGRDFMSVSILNYHRLLNLDFRFQLMENESKGKIISNPRVITENKKLATITSSEKTSFVISNVSNGVSQDSFGSVSADLSLNVTPQVTNDGSILMAVSISKGSFGARPAPNAPPDTTTRNLATNVLVDNGSTIVLGGIYNYTKSESEAGVPFLRNLPLLGWLFKTSYNPSTSKNELIIFITPRIINQEEAGLSDKSTLEI